MEKLITFLETIPIKETLEKILYYLIAGIFYTFSCLGLVVMCWMLIKPSKKRKQK